MKIHLSDYYQGISDVRDSCCTAFIGYFNVRLITTRKTAPIEIELIDDLDAAGRPGGTPVSVHLKLRQSDLYLLAFKPAAGKEVDIDKIGHTNYNNMTRPTAITLRSVRSAVRTLRSWVDTKSVGTAMSDAGFTDPDLDMHGSASIFTICSVISEAARFSSVQRAMTTILENPGHEIAVTGAYMDKIQCWSGASDAYLQYVRLQESWKTVNNPRTAPPLPPPPSGKPPALTTPDPPPPPPPVPLLAEQLMRDIVIVKLPSSSKATPPEWMTWAATRFKQYWT